jgi:cold shock CspA family protein
LDIQVEQAREQQQQQQQPLRRQEQQPQQQQGRQGSGGGRPNAGTSMRRGESSGSTNSRNSYNSNNSNNNNNNNARRSNNNNNNNQNNSGNNNNRRGGIPNRDNLPIEQGTICSLKDAFGFIHCADRPEELFFHYSEVVGGTHPDDLQIDDEVEFRVGPASSRGGGGGGGPQQPEKLAAYQLSQLIKGTIAWETPANPGIRVKGIVERAIRVEGNNSNQRGGGGGGRGSTNINTSVTGLEEGSIRLVEETTTSAAATTTAQEEPQPREGDTPPLHTTLEAKGPLVRFLAMEYQATTMSPAAPIEILARPAAIESGDVRANTSTYNNNAFRRSSSSMPPAAAESTNRLYRGDLVECEIVIDRRTKMKFAKRITLIQSERERSRLAREQKLLESATVEEGIVTSLKNDFGFLRSNKRREDVYFHYAHLILPTTEEDEDFVLKEGQEMKFLVVSETTTDHHNTGNRDNNSTKKCKCSARQIECLPKGSVVFHTVVAQGVMGVVTQCPQPPGGTGHERDGTVRLLQPIDVAVKNDGESPASTVVEDVAFQFGDSPGGVFSYQHRGNPVVGLWIHEGDTMLFDVVRETLDGSYRIFPTSHTSTTTTTTTVNESAAASPPSVKLVNVSMVGRAEGVIHTLKDSGGYGFIYLADRTVDVHFKVYDMLPDALQVDLQRHILGCSTTPLSLNGKSPSFTLQVGDSVQFDLAALGTVASSSSSSGHNGRSGRGGRGGGNSGGGGAQERENLKAQRILLLPLSKAVELEKVLARGVKGVVKSEDVKQSYAGYIELEEEVEPMTMEERYPLIAKMIDNFLEESDKPGGRKVLVFRELQSIKEDEVVVEMVKLKGRGVLNCDHIPVPGIAPHPGRICIRRAEQKEMELSTTMSQDDSVDGDNNDDNGEAGATKQGKKQNKKKGKVSNATTKTKMLRFDKSNLVDDLKEDIPPCPGDVIVCDVVQNRRTGKIVVHNMKVMERKERDPNADENMSTNTSGVGIVKEVVPNRNFGFINVLDEDANKREMLFFNIGGKNASRRGFQKGDEVKFDIGVEKNGKRVALNVEVLPKGAIPSNPSKNACLGFLLMEPSHTSLVDTPNRKGSGLSQDKAPVSGGRWANQKDDLSQRKGHQQQETTEGGFILLTEDKSGMFTGKGGRGQSPKRGTSPKRDGRSVSPKPPTGEAIKDSRSQDDDDLSCSEVTLCSHLPYKTGAIAIHGTGAASCTDGSSHPRRGDLVSFVKAKSGKGVRDIRVVKRQAAVLVRGRLEDIVMANTSKNGPGGDESSKGTIGTAKFIAATEKEEEYMIDLAEVVSCDASILKEKQAVEGILYDGKIFGVCRTVDLYLESKLGASHKERPKLNLSVKKDRGGTIIAQSMMAKVRS